MAKIIGEKCGDYEDIFPEGVQLLQEHVRACVPQEVAEYMGQAVCLMVRVPDMDEYQKLVAQSVALGMTGVVNRFDDGRMVSVWDTPDCIRAGYDGLPELEFVQAHPGRPVALGAVSIHYFIQPDGVHELLGTIMQTGRSVERTTAEGFGFLKLGLDDPSLKPGLDIRFRIGHTPMDVARATSARSR